MYLNFKEWTLAPIQASQPVLKVHEASADSGMYFVSVQDTYNRNCVQKCLPFV